MIDLVLPKTEKRQEVRSGRWQELRYLAAGEGDRSSTEKIDLSDRDDQGKGSGESERGIWGKGLLLADKLGQ